MGEVTIIHAGHPKQMQFWHSPARYRAFTGGIGSGKTTAGAVEILRQPARSQGMVVAPTYKVLQQSTLPGMLEVLRPALGVRQGNDEYLEALQSVDLVQGWVKDEGFLELVNGTRMWLRSAEAPDNLRGPNLGWFWLDEAALMAELVWKVMIGRLRRPPERGWLTFTPQGFDWVHKRFVVVPTSEHALFKARTRDNPFTSESYKASLEEDYAGSFADQELGGEFVQWVEEPIYTEFKRQVGAGHVVSGLREHLRVDLPLGVCCDFNVRYGLWPIVQEIAGKTYVLDEVQMEPATAEEMVVQLRNKYPAHPAGVRFYGDATGKARGAGKGKSVWDVVAIGMAGYPASVSYRVPDANPAILDRILSLRRRIRDGDGVARLQVDARCEHTIADLAETQWDRAGHAELQVQSIADPRFRRSHGSAALGYYMYREHPVSAELARVRAAQAAKVGRAPQTRIDLRV